MARLRDDREIIIEFLVRRNFPAVTLATLPPGSQAKRATTMGRFLRHEEMKRFREELEGLPSEKVISMYGIEQAKLVEEARSEEQSRFFNQPHAAADFDHWSKAEHWSIDFAEYRPFKCIKVSKRCQMNEVPTLVTSCINCVSPGSLSATLRCDLGRSWDRVDG